MPRQNTSPADYPQAVLQQIEQLAHNIVIARKRRGETQAQWAKKLGVSQPTFARIERGDPGVSMASYMMCMWLINPEAGLADLVSPLNDHAALEREVSKVSKTRRALQPKRVSMFAALRGSAPFEQGTFEAREPQPGSSASAPRKVTGPLTEPRNTLGNPRSKNNSTAKGLAALLLNAQAKNP